MKLLCIPESWFLYVSCKQIAKLGISDKKNISDVYFFLFYCDNIDLGFIDCVGV